MPFRQRLATSAGKNRSFCWRSSSRPRFRINGHGLERPAHLHAVLERGLRFLLELLFVIILENQ